MVHTRRVLNLLALMALLLTALPLSASAKETPSYEFKTPVGTIPDCNPASTISWSIPVDFDIYYKFFQRSAGSEVILQEGWVSPVASLPFPYPVLVPGTTYTFAVRIGSGPDAPKDEYLDQEWNVYCPLPPAKVALGDKVWEDLNANGVQDASEPGIGGVTVKLYVCGATEPLATTSTDANGIYGFTDLTPGDYYVGFTAPDGYVITTANAGDDALDNDADATGVTPCVTLASGETNNTVDAGLYVPPSAPSSICGFVYVDADNDGIFDMGEMPISGVEVSLSGTDDLGNAVNQTTSTGADGGYCFSELRPGTYSVTETQPAGYLDGKDTQGTPGTGTAGNDTFIHIILGPGVNGEDNNFGELSPANLGDFVWNDLNGNGVQDAGEAGIPGVTVRLFRCDGTYVTETTTDANGFYRFTDLTPGGYFVEFVKPAGYTFSSQNQGGDDALDSDAGTPTGRTVCTTLDSGENDLTWDAGLYVPVMAPGTGTPGYWKNHPKAWPVESITIGGVTYTKDAAIGFIKAPTKQDKTSTMFQALVAAKLNILVGNESSCVAGTVADADAWMAANPLGSGVKASSAAWKVGEPLSWTLDEYNNGRLCAQSRDALEKK